jgi:gamma-butyrobetaine dioxygenase
MNAAMNMISGAKGLTSLEGRIAIVDARQQIHTLHNVWWRDNCPCATCRHPQTGERLLFSAGIPADLQAVTATRNDDGSLHVIWADPESPHESRYSAAWLDEHGQDAFPSPLVPYGSELWTAADFELKRVPWRALMEDDEALLAWSDAMIVDGVAAITGTPGDHAEVERVAERLAHVRETAYDRLHEVRSEPDPYNVANTDVELMTHTDMPNYAQPPGVQLLHFIENAAKGGETTLADGFAVARDIAQDSPEAFKVLCETPVSFRMTSHKADIVGTSRLVTLDSQGSIEMVRFSNQLMQPVRLPGSELTAFYDAYREYSRRMVSSDYVVRFRSEPGTVVTTHNHRVLHGRQAFDAMSGPRHLQLSYLDFDDVLSRRRILLEGRRAG